MGTGTLTRYSASAGSGKTFRLASIYLSHLFKDPDSYRNILAVTFTNKATAEMKSRILDQLFTLAKGGKSKYLEGILKETGRSAEEVTKMAGDILNSVIHDYSRFSVSTIDAFFQKVIRAFARESGLNSGFSIELDHSLILAEAVDQTIASSASDPELREWLNEYVRSKLSEEKSWNPRDEIIKLAGELFSEKFKLLSEPQREKLSDKKYLLAFIGKLKKVKDDFEKTLFSAGRECEKLFADFDLAADMFYYKGKGVPGFVHSLASGIIVEPNTYVRAALADPPRWTTGKTAPALEKAVEGGLGTILSAAVSFYEKNLIFYNSAREILSNIYALGILSDILRKVREIATQENSFILSDAVELLRELTAGDQAPFIYEKTGNRYDTYMIDEFQDTSRMQWDNFLPLIAESMGNGNDNLVVGDVKQSIYRFRNSEWQILGKELERQIPASQFVSVPLDSNWRSRTGIIKFNNTLFTALPGIIDLKYNKDPDPPAFREIYAEAAQEDASEQEGGYVRIEFVDNDYDIRTDEKGRERKKISKGWGDKVLERLPAVIESLQDKGYSASDIGIIVRYSRQGTEVLNTMVNYSNAAAPEKRAKYNYNIVSDYSLTLSNSPAITFIISVMRVLNNPGDDISRAAMLRLWLISKGSGEAEKAALDTEALRKDSPGIFPEGCNEFIDHLAHLTLFEAVEDIIRFFGLGDHSWNTAYLTSFQDLVLGYSTRKNNDLNAFLDWWDKKGCDSSVVLPENQNAARIFTIHKSKGLEFKVVIAPFLSWNDDHHTQFREIIWVKPPEYEPFSDPGILPLIYKREPDPTIFGDALRQEKYSAFLDNLNLLYVALTRARDVIWGYAAARPGSNEGISALLAEALRSAVKPDNRPGVILSQFFDEETKIFEMGRIGDVPVSSPGKPALNIGVYQVCRRPDSLRLRLHGESYFLQGTTDIAGKINYGKLMHRALEFIITPEDVGNAVERLIREGELPAMEKSTMTERLRDIVSGPEVSGWFSPSVKVFTEADILIPGGSIRRPDRIIFDGEKVKVIDYKFGEDTDRQHAVQVRRYCNLLKDMGFMDSEGYIWYVEKDLVIKV
ncbi:MAG: UvrD-helicase domain-containing protein [Bacteroidales bacterium]|nr:UvrD-helicase domain-containing protein [Bacteroidales bacterium]